MLNKEALLEERRKLDLCLSGNLKNIGITYRQRADLNLNLYLTEYATAKSESNYYKEASEDYQKAIELLQLSNSGIHLSEAILAYGNAIKEQFLPLHRSVKEFTECEERAKKEYQKCIDLTLRINHLRGYFFTMLEQMNLEVRKNIWHSAGCWPKRLVIFHSLGSPLSHQYLKGIYYFASQHLIEIWEYNYGRVPTSDLNDNFILDRLMDASGAIFLCSPEYNTSSKIVQFEIEKTEYLKNKEDPIEIFVLDIGNKEVVDRLKSLSITAGKNEFENKLQHFFNNLKNIYYCRKHRCENNI